MIHAIGSSIASFRTLAFGPGLNVLLADQNLASSETDSRNSLGKSSVVEIIHFLLGSTPARGSVFKAKALVTASFWGEFTFAGSRLRVERRVGDPDKVFVTFADEPTVPLRSEGDLIEPYVDLRDWTDWLGHVCFGIPTSTTGTPFADGGPSFRSLFGYFARRRGDDGFSKPHRFASVIPDAEGHLSLAYLFGLDWTIAREFERRKQVSKDLQAESRLAKARNPQLATLAAVTAELVVAERRSAAVRDELSHFKLEEHYADLDREASATKREADRLSRRAVEIRNLVEQIETSVSTEPVSSLGDVERLYAEVGIQLPDSARRGFEEVQAFHQAVISNRRHHLAQELERNRNLLADIETERKRNLTRRTEIMNHLSGRGAFSDLAAIQRRLAEAESRVATLEGLKDTLQRLESDKSEQKVERISLKRRLDLDMQARFSAVRTATLAVDEALIALYGTERPKWLRIESTETGPRFTVSVAGDRSGGISNMEIFAMDYALFKVTSERMGGPGFLVHDSHLFDGVDARQAAAAIEIAGKFADAEGLQYLVTMNSDKFGSLPFSTDYDARSKVLPVVLEDTDEGGLFGFRFE
ncbi:ABC-three component system protein [Aliihoeflea sp. 40Bstr573]|uniref:ABC-three component system protein n=1 Tax=Aliihoeflea sp. 40Bstr573 TaxID=2696467 RepID=UPI002094DC19|nr:DUF2326 domain-containing protein [Aliihoeflea sp. 40Bstr573]MCO6386669.1 DUF2326 domain-containing protein [Aliihoeflea sp. 40Bstr573]